MSKARWPHMNMKDRYAVAEAIFSELLSQHVMVGLDEDGYHRLARERHALLAKLGIKPTTLVNLAAKVADLADAEYGSDSDQVTMPIAFPFLRPEVDADYYDDCAAHAHALNELRIRQGRKPFWTRASILGGADNIIDFASARLRLRPAAA